ncbi:hypothetical protein Tco_0824937 [Tanacetum coccineum]
MVVLDSCPKHNMVAYLEKSEGNAEFHEIIDFLKQSSIHHPLTVSPVVSTTFIEQFWTYAKSKIINNVRHITAKVAGKSVSISEASIRSDLLFDDADGIDSLPNQAIFDVIQLMGSKSTSWDQIPTNIATAVICLTSNQKYNFSKLIFDDKQLANVPVPLDHFPVNTLTSKVFSFMVKKGKHFSGKVTPLFASMLVQPTEDEGAPSERPSEAQPTPSPAHTKTSGDNLGGHSSSDKSLSGNEGDMTIQGRAFSKVNKGCTKINVSKTREEFAKGESSVQRDPLFDEIPKDKIDHMETENAQSEGRTREMVDEDKEIDEARLITEDEVSTVKEGVSTDFEKLSTDRPIVSTDGSKVSTDMQVEGACEQELKARIEADRLLAEKLQEQEREQFTIEERAKFLHDTIAAQRKFLAQQRSEAIRNRPPTKNQLRNQMMTYLKHVGNFKHAELKIKKFEEVQALYEKIKRSDEDFISIGSAEDERLIKRMNEKGVDFSKDEMIKEESKEEVKKESKAEVQEESKEEESKKKRKLGTRKKMKSRKRRYIQNTSEDDSDKENDELRLHLTIAPDEEKEVDYEILDRKYPIKEWKTECLGTKPQTNQAEDFEEINQNVVTRSNGQKRYFSTLMRLLSIFDREDLNAVYHW